MITVGNDSQLVRVSINAALYQA
ncbi:uncharacterized protein METZ01_LOCUS252739, partial [marine metagenome]